MSASLVDPVLISDVEDFEAGVETLKGSRGKAHRLAAKRLCELSRDIRLRLGPPKDAPGELVERIVRLFRDAAGAIRVPHDGDDMLRAFRSNIRDRAQQLADDM